MVLMHRVKQFLSVRTIKLYQGSNKICIFTVKLTVLAAVFPIAISLCFEFKHTQT